MYQTEWTKKLICLPNCVESVYQYWISALSQKVRECACLVSLYWWGYLMNEFDRVISPTVRLYWFDQSVHRYGILEFCYCALSYSRRYFHVLKYIALYWYFLGILWLWIILVKTVFSCLDYILSWSRGYFHILIRTVFSYVILIESTEDLQRDLKLNLTFIWSSETACDDTLIKSCNQLVNRL